MALPWHQHPRFCDIGTRSSDAGSRAKHDDTQVRSGSGNEAAAEAGIVEWFKFATISQDLVKNLVASGIGSAEDLKLLHRVKEPAVCTVFWLEKTVAEGINNNQIVQTRELIWREEVGRLMSQSSSCCVNRPESSFEPKLPEVVCKGSGGLVADKDNVNVLVPGLVGVH